ncbi:MAG: hypothetical protein ACREFU_15640, partial [Acetobacteraceae bacterium]
MPFAQTAGGLLGGTTTVVPGFGGGGLLLLRLMQPASISGARTTRAERSRIFMAHPRDEQYRRPRSIAQVTKGRPLLTG